MQYYYNQTEWKLVQPYLPLNNQLREKNLPNEYFIKWEGINIHIDHYKVDNHKGTVIVFHGVGGNGRLLSSLSLPLVEAGYEVICPDLPLYGNTEILNVLKITYDTWVDCGTFLVNYFQDKGEKISLFGLSAGGFLAYQVACNCKNIYALMASCFLDQRIPIVIEQTAISPLIGKVSKKCLPVANKLFPNFKIPIKLVGNMKKIVNNKNLAKILIKDKKSSGSRVTISFLYGMLSPSVSIEPENFNDCPVLLVHPENDCWTDVSLSKLFFDRLTDNKKITMLEGAGHFPIEENGLNKMSSSCIIFLEQCYEITNL
ncbi:alpha/beta fold hydrolase [Clostridioides sp. ZZV15-6598]|uniref:alpha/beta hydrolase n=1 Tax=Clostridioides sp. ZZV15-6598 TaxID=2811501 RepID=UPI001D119354|nr:alpha/beta fold hydrolase [Clostridioides sp. ZZV15-6598]